MGCTIINIIRNHPKEAQVIIQAPYLSLPKLFKLRAREPPSESSLLASAWRVSSKEGRPGSLGEGLGGFRCVDVRQFVRL